MERNGWKLNVYFIVVYVRRTVLAWKFKVYNQNAEVPEARHKHNATAESDAIGKYVDYIVLNTE